MIQLLRRPAIQILLMALVLTLSARAEQLSLQTLVTPSTVLRSKDGQLITFALHGFIEFKSLNEMFSYIDSQNQRWKSNPGVTEEERLAVMQDLLRRGVESRVISMLDERPLETLVTHTREELVAALAAVKEPVPAGYAEAFLAVQEKWKHSLNCWSASPSIAARVLSNWYPISEGIQLYGATYDSTEHFWQAVKYYPDTMVGEVIGLLSVLEGRDWGPWLARLDDDPKIYLPNAYAVEFLRANLKPGHLRQFREALGGHGLRPDEKARTAQQRGAAPFRFSAFEEKTLWGDLADTFHLVYTFSPPEDPIRKTLAERHFDAIYLGERRMGFISEEFRSLMLEIWHVKYLQMARFREVISSIPMEIRLEHFLNDGDSPDIPIPVYVGYLKQIRELARVEK
ncbi:MAG TPA: hypothetical protein VE866_03710 [Candidatus Binatia bacterium]|nr:hypothetical protein [Candidatus Binatia bacterium]